MDIAHGILLGFIGITLTVIGFSIAFYFANKEIEKNKKRPLTSVEQSLEDLNMNMKKED